MLDEFGALEQGLKAAGEWLSTVTMIIACLAFLTEFVRGRTETRSFRPVKGWLAAILGAFAALAAFLTLRARDVLPFTEGAVLLGIVLITGASVTVFGIAIAVLTPSADLSALRQIASAVEAVVQRCEADSGFVRSNYVKLRMVVSNAPAWSNAGKTIRGFGAARLAPASVSVMAGPAGSGKSVELWQHVLMVCRKVNQSRRPREVAVFVPVRGLPEIVGAITPDTVRGHLMASVADGNAALGNQLARYLDGNEDRPGWLFVFDLDAELTRDREEQYFEAVRNFMRHRDRDQAVIAVREKFTEALPVFTPATPDKRRVRDLLDKQGISLKAVRDMTVFSTPAMIMQFGAHVAHDGALASYVSARLNRYASLQRSAESLRMQAEHIAYRMAVEGHDCQALDLDVAPLLAAQFGGIERGIFAFRFTELEIHLAASYLVRARPAPPIEDLVRNEVTREVLVTALRQGDANFVDSIVHSVEQLVRDHVDLPGDLTATELPPVGSYQWPPVALHALAVLRDSGWHGVDLGIRDRSVIDHLVWQGVFGGGRHEREAALSLLSLASPERVLAMYRQAVTLRYDERTTSLIAIFIRQDPLSADSPTYRERGEMLTNSLIAWDKERLPLNRGAGLLVALLDGLVGTAKVTATLWALIVFVSALRAGNISGAVIICALTVLISAMPRRLITAFEREIKWVTVFGLFILAGIFLCAIPSLFYIIRVLISMATLSPLDLLSNLVLLWVFSLPAAMFAQLLHDPWEKHHWITSHRVLLSLASYRDEWGKHGIRMRNRFSHVRSKSRIVTLSILLSLLIKLPIDLPMEDARERYFDLSLLGFVMLSVMFVIFWRLRGKLVPVDIIARRIIDGSMTERQLMAEFVERASRGMGEFTQLLKVIATAPPGALDSSVHVLQSFDKLLEFFERTLPTPTKITLHSALTPDMWRYAPKLHPAELLEWAVEFDRKHPGFFLKAGNSEHDRALLSRAIDNATSTVPRTGPRASSPAGDG